jgi:hypothetical protein
LTFPSFSVKGWIIEGGDEKKGKYITMPSGGTDKWHG